MAWTMGARATFDVDAFVGECRAALRETQPTLAVRDVLDRALADAPSVTRTLGRDEGGLEPLHVSDDLTVLNVVWAPGMYLFPHDHRMWAVIGIYGGVEDNEFFRRGPDGRVQRERRHVGRRRRRAAPRCRRDPRGLEPARAHDRRHPRVRR